VLTWALLLHLAETGVQQQPGDWSVFTGYGVVGSLAAGGVWLTLQQLKAEKAERVAAQARSAELQTALLTQAEEHQARQSQLQSALLKQAEDHKGELLQVYRAVMPPLQTATELLQEIRHEREIEQAARRRTEGGAR
jgi:hypothetical protein